MSRLGRGRRYGQGTGHLIAWLSWRTGRDGRARRRRMDGKLPWKGREVHSRREGKNTEWAMSTESSPNRAQHRPGQREDCSPWGNLYLYLSFFFSFIHFIYLFLNILFYTGVELIYNVGLVSSVQQTDSATKNSHTLVFTVVLFTIVKTWKQCRRPSTEEWIKKIWYLYTMEYYSAIINNGIIPFGAMWMDQVIIKK